MDDHACSTPEREPLLLGKTDRSTRCCSIGLDALRLDVGDVPDLSVLLDRLYEGRLSDRNRSMVVLANRRGMSGSVVRAFLGIHKKPHREYLHKFATGGQAALFARKTTSTRKFDNEAIKQAVFTVLHEPPSNYGINRTTWIMPDLSRVLREMGCPACPDVIDPQNYQGSRLPLAQGAGRAHVG